MKITREYLPEKEVVIITVENPPLGTTKHTILASAVADGRVSIEKEIARLKSEAEEKLRVHKAVLGLLNG